jgi:hypothetical protein
MVTVELKGIESVKEMFKDMGHQLSPAQVRGILDSAGQLLAKEARNEVELKGELGELLKKDIGVYRDNRKSASKAEYILVGPRFKKYTIRRQVDQKVALIAQHMTVGFNQTDRDTQSGQRRGRVADQVHNPVADAAMAKKDNINSAIEKGVNKQLEKTKAKYPELVK